TDTDTDTGLEGTIDFTIVDENGASICAATIDLIGVPYTGSCKSWDSAYETTATVASEKGKCDYESYPITLTYLPTSSAPDVYLAYSSDYYGGTYLWAGYTGPRGDFWYSDAYANPLEGFAANEGEVTFSKGLLE